MHIAVPTIKRREIRRAMELRGARALAQRLGVSEQQLISWAQGAAVPPEAVALAILRILEENATSKA